jgi:hypothetical protein
MLEKDEVEEEGGSGGPLECRMYGRRGTTVELNVETEDSSIKTCENLTYFTSKVRDLLYMRCVRQEGPGGPQVNARRSSPVSVMLRCVLVQLLGTNALAISIQPSEFLPILFASAIGYSNSNPSDHVA